jgi:hypothetical protein
MVYRHIPTHLEHLFNPEEYHSHFLRCKYLKSYSTRSRLSFDEIQKHITEIRSAFTYGNPRLQHDRRLFLVQYTG